MSTAKPSKISRTSSDPSPRFRTYSPITYRWPPDSPLLASLAMFRKVVPPALQLLPRSLLRMIVSVFPVQTRVEQLKRVVGTMDKRASDIYMDKKRAFAKGDTDVVQQVEGGKDILSVLSACGLIFVDDDC